jgi:hypothetical protein
VRKLAVADQKLIVSIMFKVLAPGQLTAPTRTKAIRLLSPDRYFAWPECAWRSIQSADIDLIKLFDAAIRLTNKSVGPGPEEGYVSASESTIVLQVLQTGANTAAKDARAPHDDAELVACLRRRCWQGGDVELLTRGQCEPQAHCLSTIMLT